MFSRKHNQTDLNEIKSQLATLDQKLETINSRTVRFETRLVKLIRFVGAGNLIHTKPLDTTKEN